MCACMCVCSLPRSLCSLLFCLRLRLRLWLCVIHFWLRSKNCGVDLCGFLWDFRCCWRVVVVVVGLLLVSDLCLCVPALGVCAKMRVLNYTKCICARLNSPMIYFGNASGAFDDEFMSGRVWRLLWCVFVYVCVFDIFEMWNACGTCVESELDLLLCAADSISLSVDVMWNLFD